MMGGKVMVFVGLLSMVVCLPIEDGRSASASVGSVDQSAESSEIHTESVGPPSSEYDSQSEEYESEEPISSASRLSHGLEHSIELQGGHQTFFPSFANLFEPRQHPLTRHAFGTQEGAFSQRPNSYRSLLNYPLFGGYRNLDTYKQNTQVQSAALVDPNSGVLGSGNFGVIKGGTFTGQSDGDDFDNFSTYYNNGHGRPGLNIGFAPNPRPNYNQDQFADFRDFADINAPSNSAFSHFVVVYANKNATIEEVSDKTKKTMAEPKNIFETLELLDNAEPITPIKEPKISKAKSKLATSKLPEKKQYWKKVGKSTTEKHDLEEPLLALS